MKKLLLTIFLMSAISIQAFGAITAPYFGIYPVIQGLSYIPTSGSVKSSTDFGAGIGMEAMFGNDWFFYINGVINGELPAIDKQDETIVYWPTEEQMNKELERRMNGEYVDFVKEKIGDVPIGNFKLSTSGVLE